MAIYFVFALGLKWRRLLKGLFSSGFRSAPRSAGAVHVPIDQAKGGAQVGLIGENIDISNCL